MTAPSTFRPSGAAPSHPPPPVTLRPRRVEPPHGTRKDRILAALTSRTMEVWSESILATAALPVIGLLARHHDPFYLDAPFPWLLMPPLLVALRHGFAPGLTSAVALAGGAIVARRWGYGQKPPAAETLLGTIIVAMIAGQFAEALARRLARFTAELLHLRRQLDGFSRSYHLLELSHERLEQRVPAGLSNLRAAMAEVQRVLKAVSTPATTDDLLGAVGPKLLEVMAAYGQVHVASIHGWSDGHVAREPVATLGPARALDPEDPLVVAAMTNKKVTFRTPASAQDAGAGARSSLVVVLPLVEVEGEAFGVVAVHSMPFIAFEAANLRLLAVLVGYVADAVRPSRWERSFTDHARTDFERRLRRAFADADAHGAPSALTLLSCSRGARGAQLLEILLARGLRGTDAAVLLRDATGNPFLYIVMPLTDQDALYSFRVRLEALCRERLGTNLTRAGITLTSWPLKHPVTPDELLAEVDRTLSSHEEPPRALLRD